MKVAEKRWVGKHRATGTKVGSFYSGRNFAPLQKDTVRRRKPTEQERMI